MTSKKDHPGVYVPPPMFYGLTFVASLFLQKKITLDPALFQSQLTKATGILLLICAGFFIGTSMIRFLRSRNTIITIKPANSLQITGIYQVTRNPMYLGLAIVYLGITCLIGNWWHLILFPVLIVVLQEYVIKREERYLERAFGQQYLEYKVSVRRWL